MWAIIVMDQSYGSYDHRTHFSKNPQKILRNRILFIYSQILEGTQHINGPHSEIEGRERDRVQTWGSVFIRVQGWGVWSFGVSSLLANLKRKNRSYSMGEWSRITQMVSYPGNFACMGGGPNSLFGCFASSCVIQLTKCSFEMNVFWNKCLSNWKLNVRHLQSPNGSKILVLVC